jgi:fatty aldehyde decarbonylase
MPQSQVTLAAAPALDYDSPAYKNAYRRLNGVVIEGEQEAYSNYLKLAEMLPQHRDELLDAARTERRHQLSFQSCGLNLGIQADRSWGAGVFAELHDCFATAAAQQQLVPCLLIQAFVVECLAIALYHSYLPVADDFSRNVTETVLQDEHGHLKLGQAWFQSHFEAVKADIQQANQTVLPIVWKLLANIGQDALQLGIDLESLEEEFTIQYGEALQDIGFSYQDVSRMSAMHGAMAA